jgi:hypothetical protein
MPNGNQQVTTLHVPTDTLQVYGATGGSIATWANYNLSGTKIYGVPYTENSIFEFDTVTKNIVTYTHTGLTGTNKFQCSFLTGTTLYASPYTSSNLLEFDLITSGITLYPVATGATTAKYSQIFMWGDNLFFMPYTANNVMVFNMNTKDIQYLPLGITGTAKYGLDSWVQIGSRVYASPSTVSAILEVEMSSQTITHYGNFGAYGATFYKFANPVYYDGKLYMFPYKYTKIVEFDITTKAIVEYGMFGTTADTKYYKCLEYMGRIYSSSIGVTGVSVLIFNPTTKNYGLIPNTQSYQYDILMPYQGRLYAKIYPGTQSFIEIRADINIV